MSRLRNIFRQIFAFLSALELAVMVLLSLAIVLAVGTIYESNHDAATARHYIYNTYWFFGLLGLLALNVLCAALSRYPFKRRHTGFLIVHVGILTLLAGSFQTLMRGYEGQVSLAEGASSDYLELQDSQLIFYDPATKEEQILPVNFRFDPPTPEDPAGAKVFGGVLVKIDRYFQNAQARAEVSAKTGEINPAIEVELSGANATLKEWVFSREAARQRRDLGPASLNFIEVPNLAVLKELLDHPELRGPVLWVDGQLIPVIPENRDRELPWKEGRLVIKNFIPHALVFENRVISGGLTPENPLVELHLQNEHGSEIHLLFSKLLEFASLHSPAVFSERPSLQLLWIPADLGSKDNELIIAKNPQGEMAYALRHQKKWGEPAPLSLDQPLATGWMDFKFSLKRLLPDANFEISFSELKLAPQQKEQGPPPALHLVLAESGHQQELWLGQGMRRSVDLGGRKLQVIYRRQREDLGFILKLDDFNMGTNEGTQDAASYESQVTVQHAAAGEASQHRIAMNSPLVQGKYKIFQASFFNDDEGKQHSVLAVAYDPGIFLKYLGSLIIVLGTIVIFWFKKGFGFKKKSAAAPVSRLEALAPGREVN